MSHRRPTLWSAQAPWRESRNPPDGEGGWVGELMTRGAEKGNVRSGWVRAHGVVTIRGLL
eukprot:scaffold27425_cov53-Isochrysis_galbana.AAC.1